MDASLKKILKAVTLELRHLLEGQYDSAGKWQPGDLEQRLAAVGVRRDRESVEVDELGHLSEEDKRARRVVDAYIQLREEAGVPRSEAVAEFVRETAYTWANRLLALRCMEARELIDEVILQKEVYGGRSLEHHRLAQREPELCAGEDDGRYVMFDRVFAKRAEHLPMLFDPQLPGVALRPSPAVLKRCIALLSGTQTVRNHDPATGEVFTAPDALGWAYQYWNTEEKDRVFEKVRTQKGAKIEGADIVPATQLYTESYMVKFLVQNSLGATWMGMHPDSKLYEQWDYYVRDADRAPAESKPVSELTFLDPACGSGHFLLEAFDLLYAMYEEEGELTEPEAICDAILTQNLYGIDIDPRSVQIAEAALWMKAAERAFDYEGVPTNLMAAVSSHLKGPHWDEFLDGFEKEPSVARVLRKFGESMEHIDELGSLARPNEDLRKIIADEHAVWEQQVSEQQEGNYLFPEMRKDAVSGKLPFSEISDDEFGERLFYRARSALDAFTEQARERGEFQDQFLGCEAATGFKLLDILGRSFDVVAANPPYMGSKNMGKALRPFVEQHYRSGKRDLYSAFMLRAIHLSASNGRVGMITQQSWMLLGSYSDLRAIPSDKLSTTPKERFRGVLRDTTIESIAHLGRYAFSEIGNAHVAPVAFTLTKAAPSRSHRFWACRLVVPRAAKQQARLLQSAAGGRSIDHSEMSGEFVYRCDQNRLLSIPDSPTLYWLSDHMLSLMEGELLRNAASLAEPTTTGNSDRFIRAAWEVRSTRWQDVSRGGGFQRWHGLQNWSMDWEHGGARIKAFPGSYVRNESTMFTPGITYTEAAYGSLSARYLSDGETFGKSGPGVFPQSQDTIPVFLAFLNSRPATFLLRATGRSFMFSLGAVGNLPMPVDTPLLPKLVQGCQDLKSQLSRFDPLERAFDPNSFLALPPRDVLSEQIGLAAYLHTVEGHIDKLVCSAWSLEEKDIDAILFETGCPSGWLPIATTDEGFPALKHNSDLASDLESLLDGLPQCAARRRLTDKELEELTAKVHTTWDTGNIQLRSSPRDSDDDGAKVESFPVPGSTDVECISQSIGVHPLTVACLLDGGLRQGIVRATTQLRQVVIDQLSVGILRLLGHRWEMDSSRFGHVDPDGIVPITELPRLGGELEPVLGTRIRSTFPDVAAHADELLSFTIEDWLRTSFFENHASQFKRRPIAWQVQSHRSDASRSSAYACLVYYHKLDGDLIRKVRKQAEDVRKAFETESRGIMSTPAEARSDRQEQRRLRLEDGVAELQRFDATLAQLVRSGFGPNSFIPALRQYAIDDSTLALKARWLRRLSSLIAGTILPDWQSAADAADIHEDLCKWISEAIRTLNHHCATVGIKPPKVRDVGEEPTSADLAPLICGKAAEMRTGSLKCACAVWWKQFDDTVLDPLKQQIKEMKDERKDIKERLGGEPAPEPDEVMELKLRDRQLREDIKPIEKQIKRLKAKATGLRKTIESWTSDEPLTWEPWLAEQPLFDEVTSLDGRKPPPETVAAFIAQESAYIPDINDGVRVNIAPLQKAGILAADVLAKKDVDKAIADRAEWRADERRWVRQGKLPKCGWWPEEKDESDRAKEE